MSSRRLHRKPARRMLIFFSADQTTTILDTAKVRKVSQGDIIREGATVLVDFGNEEFEATVIKLHDDPSVLSQAQTEFETQMFANSDELVDESDDKENMPANRAQNTPITGKEATESVGRKTNKVAKTKSLLPKALEGNKRKKSKETEQQKVKKAKKIITIEAEALPDEKNLLEENEEEDEKVTSKEPLNFLHVSEQEKVRKMIAQYQKLGETEVGVQTDVVTRVTNDVGVQKNGYKEPTMLCSCHTMLEKVTNLETKVDMLISAFGQHDKKPENKVSDVSFGNFEEECSIIQTISEVASLCSTDSLPGMIEEKIPDNLTSVTLPVPSVSLSVPATLPYSGISTTVYDELFKKSSSVSNYAKNLVFSTFDEEELKESNCSGAHKKKSLERDPRMDKIKESTFKKFPMEDKKKSWAACRKAIDSAIRKLRYKAL